MPPIPPSPAAQLALLTRRLTEIKTFQLPRLLSLPGPISLHTQYASELREDLESITRAVRELEVAVDDEDLSSEREKLGLALEGLKVELEQVKKESRAALVKSKKRIEAGSNRAELLAGASDDPVLEKSDDALQNTSNEVTLALRRTMQLMQQEVERSVLSTQMLDSSSRTLQSTSTTYDSLGLLLNTSRTLITALERADWTDRALIFAALAFFLLVVGFILKQRIFDRGIRLAFWWVRFLPSFGDEGLGIEEVRDKVGVGAVVSGVVTTATTTFATVVAASLGNGPGGGRGKGSVRVETVTSVVTLTQTMVDVHSAEHPDHTFTEYHGADLVSPTEAAEPEAEEAPFLVDTFPDEATPLDDPYTAAPPEASPRHHVEL